MNPTHLNHLPLGCLTLALSLSPVCSETWRIGEANDWKSSTESLEGLKVENGAISPQEQSGQLKTVVHQFDEKRSAQSLLIEQSAIWQNWEPVKNVGPSNLRDAPVFLAKGPQDYWMFGKYGNTNDKKGFKAETVSLEGYDVELKTTPFANQFDAPGGLKPGLGGYHAWQSRDMVNWVHHGPVSEKFSRWVTSAEQVDGSTIIYYDFPNDQDPHAYVDNDLTDGVPGENKGKVLDDPSHGSDAGFIRDLEGNVHVVFEDWSPISANARSWDSPLAGHAVSKDGVSPFEIVGYAVDERTKPTGKTGTYRHPHWKKEDPENYPTNEAEYEIHEPEQEAYGDWALIAIGGQYYLFGDYDPVGGHQMSVCWFTSSSIDEQFTWCDHIGKGHPDPDIGFAEGQFYLVTQQANDFVSPGPWVETVTARVGVDTDKDGQVDQWTDWQEVKESYERIEGFSRQVAKKPAELDLSGLPEGFGFQVEVKIDDSTENKSKPIIESLELSFD
ncbi:MAG: hypothetical protein Q7Q71_07620 [Verrucomicrobiota bacterium JB023]|nr:hypothetical protein [Verrucomicrobiota bacterium JB023]